MPQTSIVLQAPNLSLFSLAIDDNGDAVIAGVSVGTAVAPILRDADATGTYWQLGVSNGGALTSTSVSSTIPASVNFVRFWTTTNVQWILMARSTGTLVTSATAMPPLNTGQIVVGQLLPNRDTYSPQFTQPGGTGTPVVPAPPIGELNGPFMSGCGHSLASWYVAIEAVNGINSAIMCCPECLYIVRILTPASLLNSDINSILIP